MTVRRCALYTRVSTEEQVERYSLEAQREVLSRWAGVLGLGQTSQVFRY
jgi:site-specific DNA recombinase